MPRPKTKSELICASENNFKKLWDIINNLTYNELNTEFDFSHDEKKKEAHWKRDKNLRDVLVHLYEWHQLLLNFVHSNMNGVSKPFLPPPYNWKTYGDMNIEIFNKHQGTSLEDAKQMLIKSHKDVMNLAENFSERELFEKGIFEWVGGSTLGSYFISTTASHYDWAIKKLKAHIKNCK